MRTESARLVRASGIVAAIVALPALCVALAGGAPASEGGMQDVPGGASESAAGFAASQFMQAGDPFDMLDQIDASLAVGLSPPSGRFVEEAGFPSDAQELRSNGDGSVASCVLEADEEAALDAVAETLGAKGWVGVPLQGVVGATYVKSSGRLRWMLVTCTQAGDATSVVYRLDAASDR